MVAYLDLDIALYIDHALLLPNATTEQTIQCCNQAIQFDFPAVCVYPGAVRLARERLQGKRIQICTVIGFPTGATTTATKLHEAQEAVENGATELDVMLNLGWLQEDRSDEAHREIAQIVEATGVSVKAIIEMGLLDRDRQGQAAELCLDAGASFIKTHTGWFGGATPEDVAFLHKITQGRAGIKAAGGIRTYEGAIALIQAGATRLGTSRGLELLRQREVLSSQ